MEPIVVVHGGAGDIPLSRVEGKLNGVRVAVGVGLLSLFSSPSKSFSFFLKGYKTLSESGDVLQAVEDAVKSMEDDPFFNAG